MQINELKAEVAKFATIRDTLAYSADVLRDVTAHQKCGAERPRRPCQLPLCMCGSKQVIAPALIKEQDEGTWLSCNCPFLNITRSSELL